MTYLYSLGKKKSGENKDELIGKGESSTKADSPPSEDKAVWTDRLRFEAHFFDKESAVTSADQIPVNVRTARTTILIKLISELHISKLLNSSKEAISRPNFTKFGMEITGVDGMEFLYGLTIFLCT